MRLAIWNNPLVATSFILRLRKGSLYTSVVLYLLLWGMAGMGWWYYVTVQQPNLGRDKAVLYFFMALLIVQTGLASIWAGIKAAAAMKNEVLSKTLDFQRIASVSPWDIMLGKLLGEPAAAYLLTIATVPIAVFCMIVGINGVGPLELFLLYVNILTTALMFGAMSLQHRLLVTSEKSSGAVPGFGFIIGMVSAASSILASAGGRLGRAWVNTPWSVALLGLLTPIPVFYSLTLGDPWEPGLCLFDRGFKIPFLLLTPCAQLAVALLCVHIMARRLVNPVTPTLTKGMAYCFLIVVDFLILGVLQASMSPSFKLGQRVVVFCILHVMASFIVMGCVTPNRELLESWAWRWRGKKSWWLDELFGERSINTLVLLVCCLLCVLGAGVLYLGAGDPQEPLPTRNDWVQQVPLPRGQNADHRDATQVVPFALGMTCLLILTFGTVYQWMVTAAKKYGASYFILFLVVFIGLPAVAGAIYEAKQEKLAGAAGPPMNLWLEMTPAVHYLYWIGAPLGFPNPVWLTILYIFMTVAAIVAIRRRVNRIVHRVESKLEGMGVALPAKLPPAQETAT